MIFLTKHLDLAHWLFCQHSSGFLAYGEKNVATEHICRLGRSNKVSAAYTRWQTLPRAVPLNCDAVESLHIIPDLLRLSHSVYRSSDPPSTSMVGNCISAFQKFQDLMSSDQTMQ
jgi:hypothetical protein